MQCYAQMPDEVRPLCTLDTIVQLLDPLDMGFLSVSLKLIVGGYCCYSVLSKQLRDDIMHMLRWLLKAHFWFEPRPQCNTDCSCVQH